MKTYAMPLTEVVMAKSEPVLVTFGDVQVASPAVVNGGK